MVPPPKLKSSIARKCRYKRIAIAETAAAGLFMLFIALVFWPLEPQEEQA
jgi:hypothetical protein